MTNGGTLTLRVCLADTSDQLIIEVCDTGSGIPPEILPKVMEPFFTTKAEGKGTGLGLPICRRIIQEHRGVLDIQSKVGKGTTVRIALPLAGGKVTPSADS
jgi:signal transduction histidine kinase